MDLEKSYIYAISGSNNILSNSFVLFMKNLDFEFIFIDKSHEFYIEISEKIQKEMSYRKDNFEKVKILFFKDIYVSCNKKRYSVFVTSKRIEERCDSLLLQPFTLIGHRGCGSRRHSKNIYTENTIDSFHKAYEDGAVMVELDTHLTSDNEVIVYHDDFIGNKRICDLTYKEFISLVNNEESCTSKPTSLKYILKALDAKIGINIEIKNCNETNETYLRNLTLAIYEIIKDETDRLILFSSFSPLCCVYMKMFFGVDIFLLVDVLKNETYDEEAKIKNLIKFSNILNLSGFVISSEYFERNKSLIHKLIKENKKLFCYGDYTNCKNKSDELIRYGISGIITDILALYK